jgi:hypothetical protein
MTGEPTGNACEATRGRGAGGAGAALGAGAGLALALGVLASQAAAGGSTRACSATATAQLGACRAEVKDDALTARAVCLNVEDEPARTACFAAARAEQQEASEECREQRSARRALCEELGEARYDPRVDPADFDVDFTTPGNPFFPLAVGNTWVYQGGGGTVTVEVLPKTKLIEGVACAVVNDRVEVEGEPVEDTDDWFAERLDGTIDYCGEISGGYELFEGDDPPEAELVDVDGSWKAGREGARRGTLFPGNPAVGQVYRQEWAPGDAEDAARVLSTTYGFGSDPTLDAFVPEALAEALCAAGDCVVTGEFTPLEPDGFERKYYARGVGLFLEVDAETGDTVQLVSCNVDTLCEAIATP